MGDGPSLGETSMLQVIISKLIKPASEKDRRLLMGTEVLGSAGFWVMTGKAEFSR